MLFFVYFIAGKTNTVRQKQHSYKNIISKPKHRRKKLISDANVNLRRKRN